MKTVFEGQLDGVRTVTERETVRTRIAMEGGKEMWIVSHVPAAGEKPKRAEIITEDTGVKDCLKELAAKNPEVITILTEEDAEQIHALVGPELTIEFRPVDGALMVWVEKLAED